MNGVTFRRLFDEVSGTEAYEVEGHVLAILEMFSFRLVELRMSRTQLAKKLNVSSAYITKLFSGQNLTLQTMVKLARALDLQLLVEFQPKKREAV